MVLIENSRGAFHSQMSYEGGLMIKGEVKATKTVRLAGDKSGRLFAKNNNYLQLVRTL